MIPGVHVEQRNEIPSSTRQKPAPPNGASRSTSMSQTLDKFDFGHW
jgi:hypothetical protein